MTESDICAFLLPFSNAIYMVDFCHTDTPSIGKRYSCCFDRQLPLSCIFCSFLIEKIITILLFGACCHNFLNYLLNSGKNCQSFISWFGACPPGICSPPICQINHHISRIIVNHSSADLVLFHLLYAQHPPVILQSTPCHVSITSINPSPHATFQSTFLCQSSFS